MKILFSKKLYILLLSVYIHTFIFAGESFKVGTSPQNTSYYILAESMEGIFRENNAEYTFLPLPTQGSVENIKLLVDGKVDFAIVQNDVAFFAKNGLRSFSTPEETLRIVLPYFKEPIFILTNIPNVHNLTQMSNKKIVVGDENTGLNESSRVILNSVGIWNGSKKFTYPEKTSLEKLINGKVDMIFVNNLTDDMKKMISKEELFIVPINDDLIKKLQKTFPYFYTHKYMLNETESISTIAVRSILITTTEIEAEKVYEIVNQLVENYNLLKFPDKYHAPKNELFKIDTPLNWHDGVQLYFDEHNIKPTSAILFDRYFWYIVAAVLMIFILLLFILSIILYKLGWLYTLDENSRFLKFLRQVYLHAIRYKYLLIIVFMTVGYAVSVLVIKYFEHDWALEHNVASTFDEYPFVESLLWLFIFGTTGYNADIFPSSSAGKLIVSLIPIVGYGGFFTLVGMITSDQIKKYILEGKGMSKVDFMDHIIICGWNDRTPLLIENLTHNNLSNKKPIVILVDNLDFNPIDEFNLDKEYVKYVAGIATDRESLRRANLEEADIAIIVSNNQSSDPDARTILNVLTIEKFSSELIESHERKKKQIYTIAEIIDNNNYQTAKDANVNQVITLGDVESKIFTQAVQSPGVIDFLEEIFTYNDFNDIYPIVVDETCKLADKTYDEILIILRKQNILLLSINIEGQRADKEVREIMERHQLSRKVITNPIDIHEQEYKVQPSDTLIVLARYEKDILEARKNI